MPYEATQDRIGRWQVTNSQGFVVAEFRTENAESLAREYAEWKNGQPAPEPSSDRQRRNHVAKAAREFSEGMEDE